MSSYPIHWNSLTAESELRIDMAAEGGDSTDCSVSSRSGSPLPVACSGLDSAANTKSQQQLEASVPGGAAVSADPWRLTIDDLPDEILVQVFSHLSFSELVDAVQKVCTRWKRLAQDADLWADKEYLITCRSHLNCGYFKTGRTDQEAMQAFLDCPSLQRVSMWRGSKARVLRALSRSCPRLSVLHLHTMQKLSHQVLNNLAERCPRIHTLRISNELLKRRKSAVAVSRLRQLRVLELEEHFRRNMPVLAPLGDGCPQLTTVHLGLTTVHMDDLRHFLTAKRNTLKSLCIKWTMADRRSVLPLLPVCADSLERLELLEYDLLEEEAGQAFSALGSLTSLRELTMAVTSTPPPGTAALAFQSGGLPELRSLQLQDGAGLEDDAVAAACLGCPGLRELSLRRAHQLTDDAFSRVCRLRHLETLDVSGCSGLGGSLLPRLAGLPRLRALWLEELDCARLQPGLSSVTRLTVLQCLGLSYSTLTGVPFDEFPDKLVNLRELHVCWCQGSNAALHRLAARMPTLAVHFAIQERAAPGDPDVGYADAEYEEGDSDGALGDVSESEEDSIG